LITSDVRIHQVKRPRKERVELQQSRLVHLEWL
jgi:hypothetical protein